MVASAPVGLASPVGHLGFCRQTGGPPGRRSLSWPCPHILLVMLYRGLSEAGGAMPPWLPVGTANKEGLGRTPGTVSRCNKAFLRNSGLPTPLWALGSGNETRFWPPAQQGPPVGTSYSSEAASTVCCAFGSRAPSSLALDCMTLSRRQDPALHQHGSHSWGPREAGLGASDCAAGIWAPPLPLTSLSSPHPP